MSYAKQAMALVQEFQKKIGTHSLSDRDIAWKKLQSDVTALGFSNPDEVIELNRINNEFASSFEIIPETKIVETFEETVHQQEVITGTHPDYAYFIVPNRPYLEVPPNYDLTGLNETSGLTVVRTFTSRPDKSTGFLCLDKGVIQLRGCIHQQRKFNASLLRDLMFNILSSLGVQNLTSVNNDVLVSGLKVGGCKSTVFQKDIKTINFFLSYNFDKSSFVTVFKDKSIFDRIYERKLEITDTDIIVSLKEEWLKLFGFEIK